MISLPLVTAFSLAWWIPQNLQHECLHAYVAKHFGAEINELWPFPTYDGEVFRMAHVKYTTYTPFKPWQRALIVSAPIIGNTFMLVLFALYASLAMSSGTVVINSLITAWAINNFLDGAVNLSTFYKLQPFMAADGWKFWEAIDGDNKTHLYLVLFATVWQILFSSIIWLAIL